MAKLADLPEFCGAGPGVIEDFRDANHAAILRPTTMKAKLLLNLA